MTQDTFWQTGISRVGPGHVRVRGYDIAELIDKTSFGEVVYLLFTGELPTGNEGRLIEAILVSCCDHSLVAPSTDAARFVASGGVPLPTAVAAGVLAIGDHHGGAIEGCARMLQEGLQPHDEVEDAARRLVAGHRERGERLPGYGHPLHQVDPRTTALFQKAEQLGLAGRWVTFARAVEGALAEATGRPLPLNVDGAIAALMLEMGIDWRLGKAFFLISRTPGLAAHYLEQVTEEKPFKTVDHQEVTYAGPADRSIDCS